MTENCAYLSLPMHHRSWPVVWPQQLTHLGPSTLRKSSARWEGLAASTARQVPLRASPFFSASIESVGRRGQIFRRISESMEDARVYVSDIVTSVVESIAEPIVESIAKLFTNNAFVEQVRRRRFRWRGPILRW